MRKFYTFLLVAALAFVPFSAVAQTAIEVSCTPVASFTTATAVPGAIVCPISVITSDASPYKSTVSTISGTAPYFRVSSAYLPSNLAIVSSITVPGTYKAIVGVPWSAVTTTVSVTVLSQAPPKPLPKVVTHLYDNLRTGWNQNETTLNTTNVASSFGLLRSVTVDEQVDAQPLVVTASGGDDQVYIATENNTVYRIEAATGAILANRNLGTPVPVSKIGGCSNNSAVVGITSTPVLDVAAGTLYVIAYSLENGVQTYRLHALDMNTLADKVGSNGVVVTASAPLAPSGTYTFNAAVSRQRAALLEANGNIYAAFASFCDFFSRQSRGWLLGWDATSLAPLPSNELTDELASSTNNYFLSSIWMSGGGPAADENGNLFFATGNSDPGGTSYDPLHNLAESVVEMSPDLSTVIGAFTPSNQPSLDAGDMDLAAGGVLLIPQQSSLPVPNLALAIGKAATFYLLDRSSAFVGASNSAKIVASPGAPGGCHCTNAFYVGSDGVPRIVSGVGEKINTYMLRASGGAVAMVADHSQSVSTGQDSGMLPSISSNGTTLSSAVIWAVTRPTASPYGITLVAFDNVAGKVIYKSSGTEAGTWPNTNADANLVPVVADGLVFVGSYKNLAIFGLGGTP